MQIKMLLLALFVSIRLLAGEYDDSVFRVKTTEQNAPAGVQGWGSAVAAELAPFGLDGGTYLLSAAHVIKDTSRVEIEVVGHWTVATVVCCDEDYDVCILKIEGRIKSLPLNKSVPDKVLGVGFKLGKSPAAVSKGRCIARSTNGNKAQWQAALSIAPGCSGGAVLTPDGQIAGIVIAGLANEKGGMRDDVTIFVPCTVLRSWLEGCRK
jgi:S1-C subfamily serine protease